MKYFILQCIGYLITIAIVVAIVWLIATSDLPDWFKFWLLR